MGRNNKTELEYFPVNVDILRDTKIRRLARAYSRGVEFYLYLLCAIYSDKGYYLPVDEQTAFDIADDMHINEDQVREMLEFCTCESVGLFSREMMERHQILTSLGIQTRYTETIRQLKRKVCIYSEYSLMKIENEVDVSSKPGRNAEMEFANGKGSEEMQIYSEEMAVNPEGMGIYSDKSRVEESKVKENKKEEISLSASAGKERENLLRILVFEKNLQNPQVELDRFEAYYEKTGWVDANGNPIRNRLAALKFWKPDKDALKLSAAALRIWAELYESLNDDDRTPMLVHFRGFYPDGETLHITMSDKKLYEFLEPKHTHAVRKVLDKYFKYSILNYRVSK